MLLEYQYNFKELKQYYNNLFNIEWCNMIQNNLNIPLDWDNISSNPNITYQLIDANPNKSWDWFWISKNPNITWDIIINNLDKPWDWDYIYQ